MKFIDEHTIQLDRELSELDIFVLDFVKILEKYTVYALISGYVAILFGRTRTTEDVDLFIPPISKEQFSSFYQELQQNGFWSVLVDSEEELFSMLKDKLAVRFARTGTAVPNVEMKFVKDDFDMLSLQKKVRVITERGTLFVSDIELQVAYKKFVLQSPKDLEDARHLQNLFSISDEKINKYQPLLQHYGRI